MKKILLLLFLSFFIKNQAYAIYATVSGPSNVCPFTEQKYEVRVYADFGDTVKYIFIPYDATNRIV